MYLSLATCALVPQENNCQSSLCSRKGLNFSCLQTDEQLAWSRSEQEFTHSVSRDLSHCVKCRPYMCVTWLFLTHGLPPGAFCVIRMSVSFMAGFLSIALEKSFRYDAIRSEW